MSALKALRALATHECETVQDIIGHIDELLLIYDLAKKVEAVTEYETVTVKVPKVLLPLLRDQNYFGRTPEKFFSDCIRGGVCSEVLDLDYDEMKRLMCKYNLENELTVDRDKRTL